jgi:response regulator RpfG family c-di-GMP phosphodiesterase
MSERILCVDDDANVGKAIQRRLSGKFDVVTAGGGEEGLEIIKSQGPFAVVVADMRMPGMSGIDFLARVKGRAPDSVRMMLTGNADLQTAIDAVNEGNIFRFLTKPCPAAVLAHALETGVSQYRLITAERELLEKTLSGSIRILIEILSLVNPEAFSRASRVRHIISGLVTQLQLADAWQFDLAAMLSQIGCVTLPPGILTKIAERVPLSADEHEMFLSHPAIGRELLSHIPRLELVARMIEGQRKPPQPHVAPEKLASQEEVVALGAQLLKLALDFDEQVANGLSHQSAVSILRQRFGVYNPHLLKVLEELQTDEAGTGVREVMVENLSVGVILDQDVWTRNGLLLMHKGQEVTRPSLIRLRNFSQRVEIVEPIRVRAKPDGAGIELEDEKPGDT